MVVLCVLPVVWVGLTRLVLCLDVDADAMYLNISNCGSDVADVVVIFSTCKEREREREREEILSD